MKLLILCLIIGVCAAAKLPNNNVGSQLYKAYMVANKDIRADDYIEDTDMTMLQLLEKYGYPGEQHEVQTADGYLLTLYRIPYGSKCGLDQERRNAPVLIQHGILSSSIDFIIMGPEHGLGYILADDCYDVWLGNNRGNTQSKKHITLDPHDDADEFWAFSWHELGKYDVPANIDYILKATNKSDLYYIGHSQGTTQFFVFGALHPEYHSKVRAMFALAPIAWMDHVDSLVLNIIAQFSGSLEWLSGFMGINEFMPSDGFLNLIGRTFCKDTWIPFTETICENVLFLFCGFDSQQLNETMLPVIMGHSPAGASTREMLHYAQLIDHAGHFRPFDFGKKQNMEIYGEDPPSDYAVETINIPISLHFADNDLLGQEKDVDQLLSRLPHLIGKYRVPFAKFNHLDFMWAIDVKPLLYDTIMSLMHRY